MYSISRVCLISHSTQKLRDTRDFYCLEDDAVAQKYLFQGLRISTASYHRILHPLAFPRAIGEQMHRLISKFQALTRPSWERIGLTPGNKSYFALLVLSIPPSLIYFLDLQPFAAQLLWPATINDHIMLMILHAAIPGLWFRNGIPCRHIWTERIHQSNLRVTRRCVTFAFAAVEAEGLFVLIVFTRPL